MKSGYSIYRIAFTIILLLQLPCLAQVEDLSDMRFEMLLKGKPGLQQARICDSLASSRINDNPTKALVYAKRAVSIARGGDNKKRLGHTYNTRSRVYRQLADYKSARADLDTAFGIFSSLNDKVNLISVHIDYGNVNYMTSNLDAAIREYAKAQKYASETNDKATEAICSNNIGNIFRYQGKAKKAMHYYQRSYDLSKELGDSVQMALSLDNIGAIHQMDGDFDLAEVYQISAMKIIERTDNRRLLSEVLMNLGATMQEAGKYTAALNYFKRGMKLTVDVDHKFGQMGCLVNLGNTYRSLKRYPEAIEALDSVFSMAKRLGVIEYMDGAAENLYEVYQDMGKPAEALRYYKLHTDLKDSLLNQESMSRIDELSAKYEADKRESDIVILTKEKDLKDAKLQQSRTQTLSVFIGLALLLILTGLIFYRYREKKKANDQLEEKNIAINEQKELVLEKNREITDSINYAKRIQESMLPSQKILNEYFRENFIFFQPKDIVSGDFYWALRKDDKLYVAAADCTGHGVPGALMSMIGVTFLRQIINEMNITDTAEILNRLHMLVLSTLNEDIGRRDSKDGMDIALLKIDIGAKKAEFAGAVRPIYMAGRNGFEVIKGDRYSIGGVKTMEESFSKVEIDLSGGKTFYLFSDGFADQFGEASGKKFMVKKLQEMLAENCGKPLEEQYKVISKAFYDWKGTLNQTDDVLLIGIRV